MKQTNKAASKKNSSHPKRKILVVAAGVLAVLLAGTIVLLHGRTSVEVSLNGQRVEPDVFDKIMQQQVSDVVFEFTKLGAGSAGPDYWQTEVEGRTPASALTEATLRQLRVLTAMYEMAGETGTALEGGLNGITTRMEAENQDRKDKKEAGQPVFGLSEFAFDTYLEYEMDWMEKQYTSNPDNSGMQVTDEEREEYYEQNRETAFKQNDGISLSYLFIDTNQMDEQQAETLRAQVKELDSKLGDTLLKDQVQNYPDLLAYFEHLDLEPSEVAAYTRTIGDVLDLAYDLAPGERTPVIDENGGIYLVQCTDRTYDNYLPLSEVTDSINKTLREQRYQEMVQRRAEEIQLEGNEQDILAYVTKKMTAK